jgi:hypothetical protein
MHQVHTSEEEIQTHAINKTFVMFSYVIGNQNLLIGANH